MERKLFLQTWKEIPQTHEVQSKVETKGFNSEGIQNVLSTNNVFTIANRTVDGQVRDANYVLFKVEKLACTNFRENKISRGLIFAIELFIFFEITFFREFRDHYHFLT